MNLDEERHNEEATNLEYYLAQSKQLRETDQISASTELLTEAIALFPNSDRLYLSLGIAQDLIEDAEGVINSYKKAILLQPYQPYWAYVTIVERLQWQQRLTEAIDFSDLGIDLYPGYVELYRHRGIVHAKLGNLDAAISDYKTAIELDVAQPLSLYSDLLKLLNQEQEFEQFDAVYHQLISLYPEHNDASIYAHLGDYFYFRHSLREALDAYEKALSINPERENIRHKVSSLHFNLGINLLERKNLTAAIKQFQQVQLIKEEYNLQLDWPSQDSCPWAHTKWQLKEAFNLLLPPGKEWPKITVVTPSFNQAEYIEATILSVINQEYDNLEYIVVDGLSGDNTKDILHQYQEQITHTVIEADRGQSDGINKGFNLGTGELMMWLNSDDMLFPGALYMLALTYLNSSCDFIAGICAVHQDSKIIAARKPQVRQENFNIANLSDVLHSWATGKFFFQPETIFTRDLWLKVGGKLSTDLYYAMDHDLWLRFAKANAKLEIIDYPIALFRKHEQQKTANSLASLSELTEVIKTYHQLEISPARKAIVEQKLSYLDRLTRPKIAIVCQKKVEFSRYINNELQTAFPDRECCLFELETIKKIGINNFDLIIIIATSQINPSIILWFKEAEYQGVLTAWIWTQENDYYLNTLIADTVDICIPRSAFLEKVIRNSHSLVVSNINMSLTQWSSKEAEEMFVSILENSLFDDIVIETDIRMENAQGSPRAEDSKAFWVDESYYESSLEERYAQLAAHKVCVFQSLPSKNSHLAILEALLCGVIVVVESKMTGVDELFSSADLKYLSILRSSNDNPKAFSQIIDEAISLFDRQGISGRKKRHDFVLGNHLFVSRLRSIFEQLVELQATSSEQSKDTVNQPTEHNRHRYDSEPT